MIKQHPEHRFHRIPETKKEIIGTVYIQLRLKYSKRLLIDSIISGKNLIYKYPKLDELSTEKSQSVARKSVIIKLKWSIKVELIL